MPRLAPLLPLLPLLPHRPFEDAFSRAPLLEVLTTPSPSALPRSSLHSPLGEVAIREECHHPVEQRLTVERGLR